MARYYNPTDVEGLRNAANDGGFSTQNTQHAAVRSGRSLWSEGQTAITSAATVANQIIHLASLGVLAAGASTTVVLANTLVTATTTLMGPPVLLGDPGAGAQLQWWISARSAGVSLTLGVRNTGASDTGGAVDFSAVLMN